MHFYSANQKQSQIVKNPERTYYKNNLEKISVDCLFKLPEATVCKYLEAWVEVSAKRVPDLHVFFGPVK